ncbi:uncharacterized protein LOC129613707 [Condylostylus longicornis]|uniref:uncharacterized protein LOC129613707 n=1 Tax=Condylostylus longicornis TaxID=2530218 RepID=UPI00244E4BC2|nr:uncharacterized protein LOC129613707 [Condylostylus longicornis]
MLPIRNQSIAIHWSTLENNEVNTDANLHELVKNFWQIESVETNSNKLTEEELSCERFFKSTVKRSSSGKIIVKLPFKRHFSELGSSRQIAEKRFLSLERRLNSNSNLKEEYSKFLEEYLRLDHMELVPKHDERLVKYYLPHHCVLKPDSSTTKFRVVFDGSCATTSGLSLNDILMIGPPVQEDLYSILLRFRFYKYGLKADICKMYRQFLLQKKFKRSSLKLLLMLCAALLLSNLINKVNQIIGVEINEIFLWSDSEIVLSWISAHPSTWTVFVANRVSQIQQLTENCKWLHVNTKANAADILSRGSNVSELINSTWFIGPDFLRKTNDYWPMQKVKSVQSTTLEKRATHNSFTSQKFSKNCKSTKTSRNIDVLSQKEDSVTLLKVGGRLSNANITHSAKHPIFLPNDEHFVKILISHFHVQNLHAGPQALLATLRQRFWITNGRAIVSKIVQKCIRCFKFRPKLAEQIMGDLPKYRVELNRAFLVSGVDFRGPVMISPGGRGKRLYKAYVAVFVYFTTHAVHLDIVSSLTSEAFIACLKRFTSRRGLCRDLYCDNATNFVGARHVLRELADKFNDQQFKNDVSCWCANHNIEFHHIPARSPHFGGLWEAAVKAAKFHLNRCCLNMNLTYDEMQTLITQIESILNSRPIISLSSDPSDEQVLTPGHFLVGGPLNALPEPLRNEDVNITSLKRFHRIVFLQQKLWSRWSKEYLTTLQRRNKWPSQASNLTMGTLVLIGGDNLPPQHWAIGKIVRLYPGSDNNVRVVDVQCRNKIFRRQIHTLAPLPLAD